MTASRSASLPSTAQQECNQRGACHGLLCMLHRASAACGARELGRSVRAAPGLPAARWLAACLPAVLPAEQRSMSTDACTPMPSCVRHAEHTVTLVHHRWLPGAWPAWQPRTCWRRVLAWKPGNGPLSQPCWVDTSMILCLALALVGKTRRGTERGPTYGSLQGLQGGQHLFSKDKVHHTSPHQWQPAGHAGSPRARAPPHSPAAAAAGCPPGHRPLEQPCWRDRCICPVSCLPQQQGTADTGEGPPMAACRACRVARRSGASPQPSSSCSSMPAGCACTMQGGAWPCAAAPVRSAQRALVGPRQPGLAAALRIHATPHDRPSPNI